MEDTRQYDCDVLVVGSGASGMSAAITAATAGLKVLIVEKEPRFGGSTARSGGWLWIPGTSLAKAQGMHETPDEARAYLRHEAGDSYNAERVDAFLEHGPRAVDFFTSQTEVQFDMPLVFPDYHAEAPGGKQGGRSMVARPYDGRRLGAHVRDLAPALPELTVFGMMLGSGKEIVHFMRATRSPASAWYVARRLTRHFLDVAKHGRGMTLTNGNALAGRLAASAFKLGIALWLRAPARSLIIEDGAVRGAVVQRDGATVQVRAARAVVLAAGGFPYDIERRKRLYAHAPTGTEHYSPSPAGNTGDGLRLAESAGACVNTALPNAAAWVPVSVVTRKDGSPGYMPHFIDRAKPGVIGVTRHGKRFTNEANSYHDYVQAMLRACSGEEEVASWLIADHPTVRRYGLGFAKPFPVPIGQYVRSGYLQRGRTLRELAQRTGIDPAGLEATIATYNEAARRGEDPEFGRGSTAYNRYLGDALVRPNPCVAPIETGPFYALKLVPGDLGTFAGLRADADARVLDREGRVIPGLYAAGNDLASIMGGNYPGGGITLGPAMTFGYIAARHMAAAAP